MHRTQLFKLYANSARWFSGSVQYLAKQNIQRRWQRMTDRYLQRTASMISGTGKTKNKSKKEPFSHAIEFKNTSGSLQNAGCQRRARQLSVVFYDYITSLLSSGEVCAELNNCGFEVTKVKVVSDMSSINVSWAATGEPIDELITALLPRCASELRSKLMDLRVMGNLPPIQFIKDVTAARLREVEELLKKADMGPDFEPTDIGESLKVQPALLTESFSPLGKTARRHQQVKFNRLEGFSFKPGPGGNLEVLSSNEIRNRDPTILVNPKLPINKEYPRGDTANPSGLSQTDKYVELSKHSCFDASNSIVAPIDVIVNGAGEGDSGSQNVSTKFRSNIYGLDRSTLYQQVLHTKRRSEDRSYPKQPDNTLEKQNTDSSSNYGTKAQREVSSLTFTYKNKAKTGRLQRDINQLLSSQFHENYD